MKPILPDKYDHTQLEEKWIKLWDELGTYKWDNQKSREETFVVDTPPPTVSGSLHVGHVFSYTHTDVIVRYQRMKGKNIFYPMGWDDNGLPTERRVQNYYRIKCNPSVAYRPDWTPEHDPTHKREVEEVSRQNFIDACNILTHQDEEAFKHLWSHLGLSVDWSLEYATIDDHCRKVSQASFLDLINKGEAFSTESPTMWDVDFQSAIAQAELEDREQDSFYHDIRFQVQDSEEEFVISTTRPELLAACIAVVAHPDDARYKHLFGKNAITPLFHAPVPIRAASHADPEKGTGILMVCTFGDIMDVEWWKQNQNDFPIKQIIGRDGLLLTVEHNEQGPFLSLDSNKANANYSEIAGLYVKKARAKIGDLLKQDNSAASGKGAALVGEPKPTRHPVKFFEKGDRPVEFIPTRQWYVKVLSHKEKLIEKGKEINWHPAHMYSRYENWVLGLNQEWCTSRQRYFGVPFPVWYPISDSGEILYEQPIFASLESLPVDPLTDTPPGYESQQRNSKGGFSGDPDVMDTWATSSLTPQIMSHWGINEERHKQLFPMDLRPQGHDIIRTWAFTTIAKALLHENKVPWYHICLSGWILDPDRKKMSKSKGNVVTPGHLLTEYSSDGVRYWAARARLGTDTAFDDQVFKIGRKLVNKLFNFSRFVLQQFERLNADPRDYLTKEVSEPVDRDFMGEVARVVDSATTSFEKFDYAVALQSTEELFWDLCDHYVELVKIRAYDDTNGRDSALATLSRSLSVFLRLFAPVLPYITDEVWSCSFASSKNDSIHSNSWPNLSELQGAYDIKENNLNDQTNTAKIFNIAKAVISEVRGAKTAARRSLKWPVERLTITADGHTLDLVKLVADDICRTANVKLENLILEEGSIKIITTLLQENLTQENS